MSPSHSRHSPRELPEDALREIFLRIRPDDPKTTFRASRVCRAWHTILSDRAFCRRYREFHRTPPLLGFIEPVQYENNLYYGHRFVPKPVQYKNNRNYGSRFVPTTAFRPSCLDFPELVVHDARHGRAIFKTGKGDFFVIWDAVTGRQCRVPMPPLRGGIRSRVSVLCAADGCDHLGCHGGPSLVVLSMHDAATSAALYSTETGAWSDNASIQHGGDARGGMRSSVLVRNTLYFICATTLSILRYDLITRELSVIDRPEEEGRNIILMTAEDGVLVYGSVQNSRLQLWLGEAGPNETLAWAQGRTIDLEPNLPAEALVHTPSVVGSMDGGNVIFLGTLHGLFTIDIISGKLKKVYGDCLCFGAIPYMSFYTLDHASPQIMLAASCRCHEDVMIHPSM